MTEKAAGGHHPSTGNKSVNKENAVFTDKLFDSESKEEKRFCDEEFDVVRWMLEMG